MFLALPRTFIHFYETVSCFSCCHTINSSCQDSLTWMSVMWTLLWHRSAQARQLVGVYPVYLSICLSHWETHCEFFGYLFTSLRGFATCTEGFDPVAALLCLSSLHNFNLSQLISVWSPDLTYCCVLNKEELYPRLRWMESLGFYCRFSSPSCRVNVKSYCGFLHNSYETTAFSVLETD